MPDIVAGTGIRYDIVTIALHWLTAILVVTLFALAQIWGFLAKGSEPRHALQALHVSLGVVLACVVLARLPWRAAFGRRLTQAGAGLAAWAAEAVHYALYGLLGVMIVAGFGKLWLRAKPVEAFGLLLIPSPFAEDQAYGKFADDAHQWGAWSIVALAGLHALAALFHHYVLRDGVLRRMRLDRRH